MAIDGNDNNQLDEGGIAIFPDIDDIQEFKVLTYNYSAEYGERAEANRIGCTTKSGSNQFHGSLFEYFRNTKLDASPYFSTSAQKFNLNQFGGSLGGPIKTDKTFFFADYQAKMQRERRNLHGLCPKRRHDHFRMRMAITISTINPLGISLVNPYANQNGITGEPGTFQCSSGTTPEPVLADGSQSPGTTCNVIPKALINSIGAKVVRAVSCTPECSGRNWLQLRQQPARAQTQRRNLGCSPRSQFLQQRIPHLRASAMIRPRTLFLEVPPTWSEANAFGKRAVHQ